MTDMWYHRYYNRKVRFITDVIYRNYRREKSFSYLATLNHLPLGSLQDSSQQYIASALLSLILNASCDGMSIIFLGMEDCYTLCWRSLYSSFVPLCDQAGRQDGCLLWRSRAISAVLGIETSLDRASTFSAFFLDSYFESNVIYLDILLAPPTLPALLWYLTSFVFVIH